MSAAACPGRAIAHAARAAAPDQRLAALAALGIIVQHVPALVARPVSRRAVLLGREPVHLHRACARARRGLGAADALRPRRGRGFHLPLSDGTLAAGAGIWCCVLVLARIARPPQRVLPGGTLDYDLRWGFLVALASGVLLAVAGVRGAAPVPPRAERGARRTRRRRGDRARLGRGAAVKALVTGATGKVGHAVAQALAARGDEVRALVRDPVKAAGVLPAGVEPVRGDVTDPPSWRRRSRAARSCSTRWDCPSSGSRTSASSTA